jgi:hypothetical protein
MTVQAVFPSASPRRGMYESFYLRAVAPDTAAGVWLRYTVHKRPGAAPRGSLWCTLWRGDGARPFQHKLTSDDLRAPSDGWIAIGDASMGPRQAQGACGEARWSLRYASEQAELRHLPHPWLYRAPLPRTKLTSPAPAARFDGIVELPAAGTLQLDGWRGMVGHNWGAEHAERWVWLHGVGFEQEPDAWLDVAIGRIRVGGRLTPWVANGALSLEGRRLPLGGLGARGLLVAETPTHCRLSLPGAEGAMLDVHVAAPAQALAGWRYADPDGGAHDVSNCSVAALALTLRRAGQAPARTLHSAYGGAYELGMREHDHGVPIAPFPDG